MKGSTNFKSVLAPYMTGLIQEKRSMGYSYKTQEYILGRFDAYCLENGLSKKEVDRNFLKGWMERRETEGCFNQAKRVSIVRQLLMYMASCGIDVYIPHDFSHLEKVQPHIFDRQELVEFFGVIDAYRPEKANAAAIRLANEYRLLFRFYCCCGLRNSEAAGIALGNVDLETGVLTIVDAKGNRDRLILILLFDLAVRVSELLDITIGDISLDVASPSILIHGKGKKQRAVLPSPRTIGHLKEYLKVFHGTEARPESFLFYTIIHGRTNRMSVRNVERIVDKYAKIASSKSDSMPKNCYPHMMRRTRATGMYQDGVPIEMVSVILGHSNTETTKIYAAPSVEQLRENMQRAQPEDTSVKKLWEGKEDEIRRTFGLI